MGKYIVEGTRHEVYQQIIEASSMDGAAKKFKEEFKCMPEYVSTSEYEEDVEVVGQCEGCEHMIFGDDKFSFYSEDGVYLCESCSKIVPEGLAEDETI